jgi:hypothetical protein
MPRASTAKDAGAQSPAVVINTAPQNETEATPALEKEPKLATWFWDQINSYPSEQWGTVYDMILFREGHSRVAMNDGYKGFLENYRQPVTLAHIKQSYGGGKFKLVLQKNSRYLTSHSFEIEGDPIYDLRRERPAAAAANGANGQPSAGPNEAIFRMLEEQFRSLNQQILEMRSQNPAPGNDRGLDLMAKSAEQAIQLITKQVPEAGNRTSEMREMIAALKDMGLIGGVQHQPKTLMEQIGELMVNPIIGPIISGFLKPADPVDQITKYAGLFDVMEKIRGPRGEANAEPQDWRAALAQHAPQILEAVKDWSTNSVKAAAERRAAAEAQERASANIQARAAAAPGQRPAAAAQPQAPLNRPTVVPESTAAASPAPEPAPLRTTPMSNPTPPAAQSAASELTEEQYDGLVKQHVVGMLIMGASAETIVDYLYDVKPDICKLIHKSPLSMVKAIFANDAILVEVTRHEEWNELIEEAKNYIAECEKEEEEAQVSQPV